MVNAYRPDRIVQRYVDVYAHEGDTRSHLVCKIDFSLGVLITYHRGEKHVVMLDQEYRRWQAQYEMSIVENSQELLTGT